MALCLLLGLALPSPSAASPPISRLDQVVRTLERHYNRLRTMKANFVQIYRTDERAPSREEAGILYLKKPGKMRWEYTRPEVKLFLSDGKKIFFYVPSPYTRNSFATSATTASCGFPLGVREYCPTGVQCTASTSPR